MFWGGVSSYPALVPFGASRFWNNIKPPYLKRTRYASTPYMRVQHLNCGEALINFLSDQLLHLYIANVQLSPSDASRPFFFSAGSRNSKYSG